MTWSDRIGSAAQTVLTVTKAAGLAACAACAVLGFLLLRQCGATKTAEDHAAQFAEAAKAKEKEYTVAKDLSQKELDARAATLAGVQDELGRLKKDFGDYQVVMVEKLRSATVAASGAPRPQVQSPSPPGCACPAWPPCLLAPGDPSHIEVGEVHARLEKGSLVAIWDAQAIRETPLPPTAIISASGRSPLSGVEQLAPAQKPGWEKGFYGGLAGGKAAVALSVVTPPVELPFLGPTSGGVIVFGGPGDAGFFVGGVLR